MKTGFVEAVKIKTVKVYNGKTYRLKNMMHSVTKMTKTIGEYKDYGGPESEEVVNALRNIRKSIVRQIAFHFNIGWKLRDGNSFFYNKNKQS